MGLVGSEILEAQKSFCEILSGNGNTLSLAGPQEYGVFTVLNIALQLSSIFIAFEAVSVRLPKENFIKFKMAAM